MLIWLIALIVFMLVEAITVGLVSLWFAFGALIAFIAAALKAQLWLQITLFITVSVITLILTRPLSVKYLNSKRKATNADRVLNMVGVVCEEIDNIKGTGAVKIGGKVWTSRSFNGMKIETGVYVKPVMIEGVKLIVKPASEDAEQKQKEAEINN